MKWGIPCDKYYNSGPWKSIKMNKVTTVRVSIKKKSVSCPAGSHNFGQSGGCILSFFPIFFFFFGGGGGGGILSIFGPETELFLWTAPGVHSQMNKRLFAEN